MAEAGTLCGQADVAKMAGATVKRRDASGILAATGVLVYRSFALDEDLQTIFPDFFLK